MKKIIIWLTASFSLMTFTCLAQAAVIYSVTFDGILNNDGLGVFGGNLNVGAGQELNLTVAYAYHESPTTSICSPSCFRLYGMQVFDNTNRLASDFYEAYGSLSIAYSYDGENDAFGAAGFGVPAGGSLLLRAEGEFGERGDILPFGTEFDMIVESGDIFGIARAGSGFGNDLGTTYNGSGTAWQNNINGINGFDLVSGEFTFSSIRTISAVPIPAAAWLFGSALLGLVGVGRIKKALV